MVYCQKKKMVVSPKMECPSYVRANEKNQKSLRDSIYGRIGTEELF